MPAATASYPVTVCCTCRRTRVFATSRPRSRGLSPCRRVAPAAAKCRRRHGSSRDRPIRRLRGASVGSRTRLARSRASEGDAWPTFRHDARRTGARTTLLPERLALQWRTEIGGRLSAVTVAAGKVFVAAVDGHTLYALDVATGARSWQVTCGGRIDSPPTIHLDRALLGSADGWIYALRVSDGELIWRFHAAPTRRRVLAFGQLESAWPAHGSVLVHRGTVYVSAGRSSFLDGGIIVYALDPRTGKVLQQRQIDSTDRQASEAAFDPKLRYDMPPDRPGAVSDVLVSDGHSIYLRHIRLDPEDIGRDLEREIADAEIEDVYRRQIPRIYSPGPQVASSAGLLTENWFNQTYWSFARASHCRLLVCDSQRTYGVRAYQGKPVRHARAKFVAGKEPYTLFADTRGAEGRTGLVG